MSEFDQSGLTASFLGTPGTVKKSAAEYIRDLQQRARLIQRQTMRPTQDEAIMHDFLNYGKQPTPDDTD